jgi:hypothetical protein
LEASRVQATLRDRRDAAGDASTRRLGWPAGPWSPGWLLVAGYLLQVVLRAAISIGRDGPTNFADETGYLANVRAMTGGVPGELSLAALYRGGYSLLLLPAHWLGRSPLSEYHGALVTNALLSGLVFPLVHVLLVRVFRVPASRAAIAAFLAALYPPLVVTTQFATAESLLPALVLAAAITLGAVVTASRPLAAAGWGIACGSCAGALYTTHGRAAPLAALIVASLLALVVLRRDLAAGVAAGVAAAVAVTLAGQRLNDWLNAKSWGGRKDADLQHVLDSARTLGSLRNVAALGLGQSWYLFVGTFGLVVLGLVHVAAHLPPGGAHRPLGGGGTGPGGGTHRPADGGGTGPGGGAHRVPGGRLGRRLWLGLGHAVGRETGGAPVVSVFLLGSVVGLVVVAGLFLNPPLRPDHVVYGRYVEIVAPPLLALGLVRLWTARVRRVVLEVAAGSAVAVLACAVASVYAGGLVRRGPVNWYTVLALPVLAQTREQIRPVTATLVALAGAGFLLVLARRPRFWAVLGVAGVLVAASIALRVVVIEARDQAIYGTQPVGLSSVAGLDAAREVAYDVAAYTPVGLYGYQWQLPRTRFVLFDSRRDPVPRTRWVIAGVHWPQARNARARRVWVHEAFGQALWRLRAPP